MTVENIEAVKFEGDVSSQKDFGEGVDALQESPNCSGCGSCSNCGNCSGGNCGSGGPGGNCQGSCQGCHGRERNK